MSDNRPSVDIPAELPDHLNRRLTLLLMVRQTEVLEDTAAVQRRIAAALERLAAALERAENENIKALAAAAETPAETPAGPAPDSEPPRRGRPPKPKPTDPPPTPGKVAPDEPTTASA